MGLGVFRASKVLREAMELTRRGLLRRDSVPGLDRPMLVISYDDGHENDYSIALPIHRREGVPAETCVVSAQIGSPGHLSIEQLRELESDGWEIVSHSKHHNPLSQEYLIKPSHRGDDRLCVTNGHRFQIGAGCVVGRPDRGEKVSVVGYDQRDRDRFLVLGEPLRRSYGMFTPFSISAEQMAEEVIASKAELHEMGLDVCNFTYPYNAYSVQSTVMVSEHYHSARAGMRIPRLATMPLNRERVSRFRRFALYARNFEEGKTSRATILRALDRVARETGLCILFAHTGHETFSPAMLEFVIEEAKRRNISFATRKAVYGRCEPSE